MSVVDLDQAVMDAVRGAGSERFTTFLLGAGASTTSGLPDWDTFAARVLTRSGASPTEALARRLVGIQDPILAVEAAKAAISNDAWPALLSDALYDGAADIGFSALHLATVEHLVSAGPERSQVATLNFDVQLEYALRESAPDVPIYMSTGGDRVEGWVVQHLHGVITPDDADDVVLTLSDFTDVIARHGWQRDFLVDALDRGALVIAGTSYRDPDIRQWLHLALAGKPPGHEALVLLSREGFRLSRHEYSQARKALELQWKSIGIKPILLQDFADAAQVIRELQHVSDADYRSPRVRSADLRRWLLRGFEKHQRSCSELLRSQAETAKAALGASKINLTLWVAGASDLIRFASHDRVFAAAENLRRVPVGHDSPWVAGRALGLDALTLQDLETPKGSTRRWRSVFAAPITIERPGGPPFSAAVLTIGAPRRVSHYDAAVINDVLSELAEEWSQALSGA